MKLQAIMELRDNRIHISSVMLMGIIDQLQAKHSSAYIAEIHAYYMSERTKDRTSDMVNYTEGGIYSMLSRLADRKFVYIDKHGAFNSYSLTVKGAKVVSDMMS